MARLHTKWRLWGVFTKRTMRLVDTRSTYRLAMIAAVGRSGAHTVRRIEAVLCPERKKRVKS